MFSFSVDVFSTTIALQLFTHLMLSPVDSEAVKKQTFTDEQHYTILKSFHNSHKLAESVMETSVLAQLYNIWR